jgi:hypothetical protein
MAGKRTAGGDGSLRDDLGGTTYHLSWTGCRGKRATGGSGVGARIAVYPVGSRRGPGGRAGHGGRGDRGRLVAGEALGGPHRQDSGTYRRQPGGEPSSATQSGQGEVPLVRRELHRGIESCHAPSVKGPD